MASPEERLLALAVARGLLEPAEARDRTLEELVAAGRLRIEDRRSLERDLADLEASTSSDWSWEMTGASSLPGNAQDPPDSPTTAIPTAPGVSPDPVAGLRAPRPEGLFKASSVDHWGRFEDLQLAGEGGMGRIFRATDPRLHRPVALKLLRREEPDLLARFLREAQLQARVDHPNVCRVYEVGEWRGQPYIAMQLVQGETLREAAPKLTRDILLDLMVQVCEGVHAAHRVGLVHRDLKPSNLMVEWPGDGGPRACVLDFGLARGPEEGGVTQTGHVMGTVSFMSPEQVQGDAARLDRRSDVYSLGATLFMLLTGRPPFEGEGLACMSRIAREEAPPLRRLRPDLPPDLETVIQVCLEKDPRRRYATARALGEDLQRILDGEPIQARPATLVERSSRWVRRHKPLVAATAAVLTAAATFGGLAFRERLVVSRRAAYAQRLTQEAERVEALMRAAKVAPAHDLRRESEAALDLLDRIGREVAEAGSLARGPGAYALGRGRLALGDLAGARQHLEQAWSEGFRTSEVAYELGRTLSQLFTQEQGRLQRIPDPEVREAAQRRAETELRQPALRYLRQGHDATLDPAAYQEGMIALVDGRPDEALQRAGEALEKAPWFYQAHQLEAEAHAALARGSDSPARAQQELSLAMACAAEAARMAPSDPDMASLRTGEILEFLRWNVRTEAELAGALTQMESASRAWSALEATNALPLFRLANAYLVQAERDRLRMGRFDGWLAKAQALVSQGLALGNHADEGYLIQANLLEMQAVYPVAGGKAPGLLLQEALASALQARARDDSNPEINFCLLRLYVHLLGQQFQDGQDDRGTFEQALGMARDLMARYPKIAVYPGLLGTVLVEKANNDSGKGQSPSGWLAQALPLLEEARRRQPLDERWVFSLANAHYVGAEFSLLHGPGDPEALDAARREYGEALRVNPGHADAALGLAMTEELTARLSLRRRQDPTQALKAAERALEGSQRVWTDNWLADLVKAQLDLDRARWARQSGQPIEGWVAKVRALDRELARRGPNRPELEALRRDFRSFLGEPGGRG